MCAGDGERLLEWFNRIGDSAGQALNQPKRKQRASFAYRTVGAASSKSLGADLAAQHEQSAIVPVHADVECELQPSINTIRIMVTPCVCGQQVRQLTVDTRQPAFRLASVEIGTSTFGEGEKIGEMPTHGCTRGTRFDQAIVRVLPHGFQHAVAQLGRCAALDDYERQVDESLESLEGFAFIATFADNGGGSFQRPAPGEHRKTLQPSLLVRRELLVTPVQRSKQRLMS